MNYTIAWIIWLLQFVAIEGAALANKSPGDTLSEHVWKWASMKNKGTGWRFRRIALLGFMSWLTMHFLFPGMI